RSGFELHKITCAFCLAELQTRHGAGTKLIIPWIQPQCSVALVGGFLEQSRVAQDISRGEMGIGAVLAFGDQSLRLPVSSFEIATIRPSRCQLTGREYQVRIKSQRSLKR